MYRTYLGGHKMNVEIGYIGLHKRKFKKMTELLLYPIYIVYFRLENLVLTKAMCIVINK